MQSTYWAKLTQYKYSLYYLNACLSKSVKVNRTIKVAMAIASSSAIAAWAAWQNLAFVWGLIIVISQVISAINEFLPYKNRINEISDLKAELSSLYIQIERDWFRVSSGSLDETEINSLCYDYAKQWESVLDKHFIEDSLPQNEKCKSFAEREKEQYFIVNFGGDTNA